MIHVAGELDTHVVTYSSVRINRTAGDIDLCSFSTADTGSTPASMHAKSTILNEHLASGTIKTRITVSHTVDVKLATAFDGQFGPHFQKDAFGNTETIAATAAEVQRHLS